MFRRDRFLSTVKVTFTVEGKQVELDVFVKKTPNVGFGPKEPKATPEGSVIWKVISLSHVPPLKVNSTTSPLSVSTESTDAEPLQVIFATVVPLTETSMEAPFHPSP